MQSASISALVGTAAVFVSLFSVNAISSAALSRRVALLGLSRLVNCSEETMLSWLDPRDRVIATSTLDGSADDHRHSTPGWVLIQQPRQVFFKQGELLSAKL